MLKQTIMLDFSYPMHCSIFLNNFFSLIVVYGRKKTWGVKVHEVVEVFYILRVFRIFSLAPKHSGLRVLLLTLRKSIRELILYLALLFVAILIFASFIFYAEQIYEGENNEFESILVGLWWAIVI